ncbi:MAG UNVERIFIED_CONTAM: hypothetical protein LVR18_00195 [Planctomycetaceae bacterium]
MTASLEGDELSVTGVVDEGCLFGGWLRLESTLRTTRNSGVFEISGYCHKSVSDCGRNGDSVPLQHRRTIFGCGLSAAYGGARAAPRNARAADGISMWNLFGAPETGYAERVYFRSRQSTRPVGL